MPQEFVYIGVRVVGVKQLGHNISGRLKSVESFRGFFNDVAADFYRTEENVFAAGGSFEGLAAWAPLSKKYAAWKTRHFPGAHILIQTGALRDALTQPDAPGSIYELSDDELRMGASVTTADGRWDIGSLHQDGTGTMPARPPLRISKPQRSRWMRFLRDHVSGE